VVPNLALATCERLPRLDPDAEHLVPALEALGITATPLVWDDPHAPFADADLTVIRTCWDYVPRRDQFCAFVESLPAVCNDPATIRWNTDKVYLRDLETAGFPIPRSHFAPPGTPVELPRGRCVLKPTVGSGSRGAHRFEVDEHEAAQLHAAKLHAKGLTVLTQPYIDAVDTEGETAMIFFNGVFSHSITKGAMLLAGPGSELDPTGLAFAERITPHSPTTAEYDLAQRIVDWLTPTPLYARVDLLPGPTGPLVVELELVEPGLFFSFTTGAEDRFARAISDRLVALGH